ncbi:MAG: hypothetical protein RLZZ528_1026 [Pseudomonadota bacterium]|jgi:hypothetical protein
MTTVHHGSCLCGAVAFTATGPLRDVFACHCTQCRRWSGHYWSATSVPLDRFHLTEDRGLAWFRASDIAERGFCRVCGSSLFWKPDREYRISLSPATLDGPTGLRTTHHWHREDAPDYYAPEGPPPDSHAVPAVLNCACLCGGVAFSLPGPAGQITACHCDQCRKISGEYSASFDAAESELSFTRRAGLAEYVTPGGGRRGFCGTCGSSLFFRAADGAFSVEAGCVTGPTGGRLSEHIFTARKGDWYDLTDGLPQKQAWE